MTSFISVGNTTWLQCRSHLQWTNNAKMEETYQREKIGSISHKLKRSMSLFTSDIGYRESCMISYPDKKMHVYKTPHQRRIFFWNVEI